MSLGTLPRSGMTRAGSLYELPMPELPTVAPVSSSLPTLPTPHAGLGERGRDGVYPNPRGQQDLQHEIASLLPTPTVVDMGANKTPQEWAEWTGAMRDRHGNGNGHGASLTQEALALLPTPETGHSLNGHGKRGGRAGNGHQSGASLEVVAESIGAATPPPSPDGSDSPDPHPHLPFPAPTGDHDSLPSLSSG